MVGHIIHVKGSIIIRDDKELVVAAFKQEDLCSVGCFGGGGKGF